MCLSKMLAINRVTEFYRKVFLFNGMFPSFSRIGLGVLRYVYIQNGQ